MDYLIDIAKSDKTEIEIGNNFYISISPEIYQELMAYVDHYEEEVSGCGMVEIVQHEDKTEYAITEAFLPKEQDNSRASTDIDEKIIHNVMHTLLREGKDTTNLRMHWHSHADMSVFHSGTDEDNYATLLKQDFFVSLVLNKEKHVLGRIDLAIPFTVSISGVPVYIKVPFANDTEVQSKIKSNLKALDKYIDTKPVVSYNSQYSGFGNYHDTIDEMKEKRRKKGKKHKTKDEDLEEYGVLLERMETYTPYEQKTYESCAGVETGNHTCNNPLECASYHDILDEMEQLELTIV